LTIVKNAKFLPNYPYTVLPPDVVALMLRCHTCTFVSAEATIKLFEAYSHVTNAQISYTGLSTKSFLQTAQGFLGSLWDTAFLGTGRINRTTYRTAFRKTLGNMGKEIPVLGAALKLFSEEEALEAAWAEARINLCPDAIRYWNGWEIVSQKGKTSYLPIPLLWLSHGNIFAETFYKNYRQQSEKTLKPAHSEVNKLITYLYESPDAWPVSTFKNPIKIKQLFIQFMIYYFEKSVSAGHDLRAQVRSYSRFIYTIDQAFLQSGAWAKPFSGELPRPASNEVPGTSTRNLRKTSVGVVVMTKLVTLVPLEITDTQAIEILFKTIQKDISTINSWATMKCRSLRKARLSRNRLAMEGKPLVRNYGSAQCIADIGPKNICATFNKHGLSYFLDDFDKKFGSKITKAETADLLAIPRPHDFLPFQLLLIDGHPDITESFLDKLELYNKHGQLSGFTKTKGGAYELLGYKDRKGGRLSEQAITLTAREAVLVRQVIRLTEPLRAYLREKGDDAWRFLFLHCPRALSYPVVNAIPNWNQWSPRSIIERLTMEFAEHSDLKGEDLEKFIYRISPTTFRASCGIAEYIRTGSVDKMARALGHSKYSHALLSSYLPEPILAFFQSRWIRIFQKGIICEAMKGSHLILQAASFESMDELHVFLKNHSLKDIPLHLSKPDYLTSASESSEPADRVVIALDEGVLTALLSLKEAVRRSNRPNDICARAIYWSKFADLVMGEIGRGWDENLKVNLSMAQNNSDPDIVEPLIYATAS
jgi:hypothetical protein